MFAVINTSAPLKIRDISPTAIRLHPDLREKLAREAAINNRSLHAEMVVGLTAWVETRKEKPGNVNTQGGYTARESQASWPVPQTDSERALLSLYNRLSPEKQLALLSLLK
ncbi:MAG: hypothetical protein Q7K57_61310 [Burkholderiaceae bacterium]|nr:hypothetical protein [Burkholderiaceae bacterium]